MGRESQAARPEPGRDDQAGSSGQALHRSPWLHQEGVGHRGYCPLLERKPRQRAEVLPHPGPELCLQGHHQGPVRHPQGCLSNRQVRPTLPLVVSPEPCPFCSCTLLSLPGPGWPTTTRARVESVSSTVSRASTEASPSLLLVSSSTAACTSVCSIP